jgi:hypothetical protein
MDRAERGEDMADSTSSVVADVARNNATRYLCVAAHVDDQFADSVFNELFGDELRAVAPSFGCDARTVAVHCLAARQRRRTRDILLVIVGLVSFFAAPLAMLLTAIAAWFLGWLLGAVRPGGDGLSQTVRRDWKALVTASVLGIVALGIYAVVLVAALIGTIANGSLLAQSSLSGGQAASQPALDVLKLLGLWLVPFVGWAAMYVIVLRDRIAVRRTLMDQLRWEVFRHRPEPSLGLSDRVRRRLDEVTGAQSGNVTVYSGYRPFVGSGGRVPGWSFAMSLSPTDSEKGIKRFSPLDRSS